MGIFTTGFSSTTVPTIGVPQALEWNGSSFQTVPITVSSNTPLTVLIAAGNTAVSEVTQTFSDVNMMPTSNVICTLSGQTPPNKDQDELTMDALHIVAFPSTGSVTIYVRGLEGSIAGNFYITYQGY